MSTEDVLLGLKEELRGYEATGNKTRAAEVVAVIEQLGGKTEKAVDAPAEKAAALKAAAPKARARKAPSKS